MGNFIDEILALKELYKNFFVYDDGEYEMVTDRDGNEIDIDDYDYEYGASKIVFLFDDYVVKIPLTGKMFYNNQYDRIDFDYCNEINYCGREIDIYRKAKRAGVDKFFLKSRFINEDCEIQERGDAPVDYFDYLDEDEREISNSFSKYARENLSNDVMNILSRYYSGADIRKFSQFIEVNQVNDLSVHNMIMKNNLPVFMDYSGFCFDE